MGSRRRLVNRDHGSRFPADAIEATGRVFEKETRPVGLLLVERILELVGGGPSLTVDLQGNQLEIDPPRLVPA